MKNEQLDKRKFEAEIKKSCVRTGGPATTIPRPTSKKLRVGNYRGRQARHWERKGK